VKGVPAWLAADAAAMSAVEEAFLETARLGGYERVYLPLFEHTEVFARGVGASTDIVQKEMYTFSDRGSRSLTLRPEGTASVVRAALTAGVPRQAALPVKYCYAGDFYRYERPQSGRHRTDRECSGEWHLPRGDAAVPAARKRDPHRSDENRVGLLAGRASGPRQGSIGELGSGHLRLLRAGSVRIRAMCDSPGARASLAWRRDAVGAVGEEDPRQTGRRPHSRPVEIVVRALTVSCRSRGRTRRSLGSHKKLRFARPAVGPGGLSADERRRRVAPFGHVADRPSEQAGTTSEHFFHPPVEPESAPTAQTARLPAAYGHVRSCRGSVG
jgi:hypothetical protein